MKKNHPLHISHIKNKIIENLHKTSPTSFIHNPKIKKTQEECLEFLSEIKKSWSDICGPLEPLGTPKKIKDNSLHIEVTHSAYKSDFLLSKNKILLNIKNLNKNFEILELQFYLAQKG